MQSAALTVIRLLNRVLRRLGLEIVWFNHFDNELAKELPPSMGRPGIRDLLAVQAVATPAEVSIEEARFLGELVGRTNPNQPIIEIGTLFGHSTTVLTLFKQPDQPLIGVDNFCWNPLEMSPEFHEFATRRVLEQAVEKYNVVVENVDKDEYFKTYSGPAPGLVFCDADHSYEATLADINWARSVGAGIVCGHDYGEDERVTAAVDSLGGPKELVGRVFVV